MKTLKIIPFFLFIVTVAGCATQSSAPRQALPTSRIYDAPKNVVWPIVVQEIGLNYPVKAVEKDSGLLTTDLVSMPAGYDNMRMNEWVFPPRFFLATWGGLRMTMSVLVTEPETNRTQVLIRTHYEAFENNVSHLWIVCESNGGLENSLLGRIADQLATKSTAQASN